LVLKLDPHRLTDRMKPLDQAPLNQFAGVRFVLTDMDETLTYQGRLSALTYNALERLQRAGPKVIPVTAAPAGWCDQMARMWPVDGVIGENGGVFLQRDVSGHGVVRTFWNADLASTTERLMAMRARLSASLAFAEVADDQPFRLTTLAFKAPDRPSEQQALLMALREAGADATVNNLWVLGWLGGFDKLQMARRVLLDVYDLDIDVERDAVLYVGDSTNDAPMFEFFRHAVGVSTVRRYLSSLSTPPQWITDGPGGDGFVEVAEVVISAIGRSTP